MSEETLQELSRNLKERVGENNSYHGFLDAVKNVEERIALLHKQDRYGRVKKMTREDRDAPYESVVTSEDLEEMRQLAKNVQLKAKAYLDHKGGGYHRDYASKRIEAAKLAYKLGEDGAKLKSEEVETSERSMKQALEEVNRRVGDKLEASQWEPGKQSPFEKTDFDAVKNDPQPQINM